MDMDIRSSSISCLARPDCSTGGIKLSQNKAKYGLAIQYFLRVPIYIVPLKKLLVVVLM